MVIVYVISSLSRKYRYIGITNNIIDRLKRHNKGRNISTKSRGSFKLVYSEEYQNYAEARKREKFLKSGIGRKFLDNLVK